MDWSAGRVALLSGEVSWERGDEPRRAGVSSFGISGTNAHVILEEAPAAALSTGSPDGADADDRGALGAEALTAGERLPGIALAESGVLPWILSAKNEPALRAQAERLRHHLSSAENTPAPSDTDVALALTRRSVFEHRAVVLAGEREGFLEGLGAVTARSPAAGSIGSDLAPAAAAAAGGLAFLFTGQGAQRAGMGRELYDTFPVFASALEELCSALDAHLERPLRDLLFAPEGSPEALRLDETQYTQAALFALEAALSRCSRASRSVRTT